MWLIIVFALNVVSCKPEITAKLTGSAEQNTPDTHVFHPFIKLGISLLIALLVWGYYRRKTFALSERYSTFGPRFWTWSVDSCVLWPIGYITIALLALDRLKSLAPLFVIMQSVASFLYTVVMHARYGQTVGKMVTKVRVLDFPTKGRISWRQAWLREGIPMALSLGFLGWMVFHLWTGSMNPTVIADREVLVATKGFWFFTALPGLWFVAEVLTMLTNAKRRALHDFIAGTVVVRTNIEDGLPQPEVAPNIRSTAPIGSSGITEESSSVQ
jgi:uncharacterized RDD family membrane protein YckC